jgi:hypothetical protein
MDSTTAENTWRKCSSCKKSIALGARYYICSVSTCNGLRTGYVFCSVHCFERHLPAARHKDAGAVEMTAPKITDALSPQASSAGAAASATGLSTTPKPAAAEARAPNRVFASSSTTASTVSAKPAVGPREVLVIASRLKDYVQARSEYNTSQSVMDVLSDHLRVVCDRAIDNARADGRKTVMDRDFEFLRK